MGTDKEPSDHRSADPGELTKDVPTIVGPRPKRTERADHGDTSQRDAEGPRLAGAGPIVEDRAAFSSLTGHPHGLCVERGGIGTGCGEAWTRFGEGLAMMRPP